MVIKPPMLGMREQQKGPLAAMPSAPAVVPPFAVSKAGLYDEAMVRSGSAEGVSPRLNRLRALTSFCRLAQKPSKTFMPRSSEVETVKVHYLVPHRYKVLHELFLAILTCVDFSQGP